MPPNSRSPLPGWFEPLESLRVPPVVVLLIFAGLIALARFHTYNEPVDRDLADYAVIGHEMHFGKRLYTDLPDQKPPAIHLTYYWAESIAGYGRPQFYLLTVTASVVTLFAAYAACALLLGDRVAALWAAAFWTVISGHLFLEANQPNSEVFMNAFVLIGLALWARGYQKDGPPAGWGSLALAGACFGWATLYKQVIAVTPALLGAAYILAPPPGKSRLRALLEVLLVGGMILAAWGITFGYLALHGQAEAFVHWVFSYNQGYAGSLDGNLFKSLGKLFPPLMTATLPLAALALLGIGAGLWRRQWQPAFLLLALAIGTHVAVALPGRFFPHYYQLWFPWLIVGAGMGVAFLRGVVANKRISLLCAAGVLAVLVAGEAPNYGLPADRWSALKYGTIFVRSNIAARQVNRLLKPGETFFQFSSETDMYVVSGRRPVSAITSISGLFEKGAFREEIHARMMRELAAAKPDLLVVNRRMGGYLILKDKEIGAFCRGYVWLPALDLPPYIFMVRSGSDLERRLGKPASD